MVASKIGLFKCWDLLEVMTDPNTEPENQNLSRFKLSKATKEIVEIVEMKSAGRKIKVRVYYADDDLKNEKFLGDARRYQ